MSERYPGGIISKTAPVPTGPYENGTAPGIWTLDQQLQYKQQGIWPLAGNLAPYIEDVFSTWLYTGTYTSGQSINNGIDLASKGGMVWSKARSAASAPFDRQIVVDTVRGGGNYIQTNLSDPSDNLGTGLINFTSTGYNLASGGNDIANGLSQTYVSWTFREQSKFFDVVTYTGTGANRTIAHNLGSVPGCIIVKRTDTTGDWQVYHQSLANTEYMVLNSTAAKATGATRWNSTTPTSTVFSVGTDATVNASGGTYVAYIYASNAGGFGLTGTDNVISCGAYTDAASYTVNLGFEPQFLLVKAASTTSDWVMLDNMRGFSNTNDSYLLANSSGAEGSFGSAFWYPTATGFGGKTATSVGQTMIYIAIRRGPMKVPTDGTKVFAPITRNGTGAFGTVVAGLNPDLVMDARRNDSTTIKPFYDKLRGASIYVTSTSTAAETTQGPTYDLTGWTNTGYNIGYNAGTHFNQSGGTYVDYVFQRAPGFFDEVCYTGTGTTNTQNHNLGVVPELAIVKRRNSTGNWEAAVPSETSGYFYVGDPGAPISLNTTNSKGTTSSYPWASYATTTTFSASGLWWNGNTSGGTFVAYLFATCAGVSKVGSYTGTGTTQQINCGFTAGSRFVLIKRTDSTGDWYVWDSARGIVAGNDPYLLLNSTAAEVTSTDYVDTYSAGFEITSTAPAAINASGGTFIFLAIA